MQQLLPKRNSQSWESNRKALSYEPWNMSFRLRGHCRPSDKLSVLSEPLHARWIGNYYLDAETSSVTSVFIVWGYLKSNAQNRHPFHHLPSQSHKPAEMSGLWNFLVRVQSWSDKIESNPVQIRKFLKIMSLIQSRSASVKSCSFILPHETK